ncbi:MAG: kelch repeat-containing protein, partial [Gallionella sp.]
SELYDPAAGTWSATGALITARRFHTATLLADGKVLVTGGGYGNGTSGYEGSSELYDPAGNAGSGSWTATGSLITARYYHTATLLPDGKVLVTGGFGTAGLTDSSELYDPATGTWSATGSMLMTNAYHSATLLPTGKVMVVGGGVDSSELYDPATGTWSVNGSVITARYNHTTTLLPNGKLLVTGGLSGSGILASSELYW